jgi:hypothetical protein
MAMTLLFERRAGLAKMKGKTTEAELLGETFTEWIIVVFKAPTRLLVTLILAFLLVFLNSGGAGDGSRILFVSRSVRAPFCKISPT